MSRRGARMAAIDLRREAASRGISGVLVRASQIDGRPVLRVIAPAGQGVPPAWQGYRVVRTDRVEASRPPVSA